MTIRSLRTKIGLPLRCRCCRTARIGGCAVEGPMPVRGIRRLLAELDALGLAVPGMPVGPPGTVGPACGGRRDPYDVLLVHRDGSSRVHASCEAERKGPR